MQKLHIRRSLPKGKIFPQAGYLLALLVCLSTGGFVAPAQSGRQYGGSLETKTEVLPFATYDTDAGFGLGLKLFGLNHLQRRESFDVVLYWSANGERRIRTAFSVWDPGLRQGEAYPLALDVVVDYNKWTSYKFFGVGNKSRYDDQETYTKEPLELSLMLSRGITAHLVGAVGIRGRWIANTAFSPSGQLAAHPTEASCGRASALGVVLHLKYDTRQSHINPLSGVLFEAEGELAPSWSFGNTEQYRGLLSIRWYRMLVPGRKIVLAARSYLAGAGGPELPVQMLVGVGGSRTVRGYGEGRYLDRVACVTNLELRFPIIWRLGGILGVDAGKVWSSLSSIDMRRWATSPVLGIRLFRNTMVVRADLGFGRESLSFHLGFGHLF